MHSLLRSASVSQIPPRTSSNVVSNGENGISSFSSSMVLRATKLPLKRFTVLELSLFILTTNMVCTFFWTEGRKFTFEQMFTDGFHLLFYGGLPVIPFSSRHVFWADSSCSLRVLLGTSSVRRSDHLLSLWHTDTGSDFPFCPQISNYHHEPLAYHQDYYGKVSVPSSLSRPV